MNRKNYAKRIGNNRTQYQKLTDAADPKITLDEILKTNELKLFLGWTKILQRESLINGSRCNGMASLLAREVGLKLPLLRNAYKVIGLICDIAPDPMQAVRDVCKLGWLHLSLSRNETSRACAQIESMFKVYEPSPSRPSPPITPIVISDHKRSKATREMAATMAEWAYDETKKKKNK